MSASSLSLAYLFKNKTFLFLSDSNRLTEHIRLTHTESFAEWQKAGAGCTSRALSILVVTVTAPDVWPSILTEYTYDSELDNADGVPPSVSTQLDVPEGKFSFPKQSISWTLDTIKHGTHNTIIQLFIHPQITFILFVYIFLFQICTCQTSHIIVCIVYCILPFCILPIVNLYIVILLSVSCCCHSVALGASVTITNPCMCNIPANKAHSYSESFWYFPHWDLVCFQSVPLIIISSVYLKKNS